MLSLMSKTQTSRACPLRFYSVLVSISVFMALSTIFHSINSPGNSPLPQSVLSVSILPYWSFQLYNSSWKSPSALSPRELTFTWWGCCTFYFWHKPTTFAHSVFILFLCLFLSLWPFQLYFIPHILLTLSAFLLCSSGLISSFLVLSTVYFFMKVSFGPDIITQSTNWLTNPDILFFVVDCA